VVNMDGVGVRAADAQSHLREVFLWSARFTLHHQRQVARGTRRALAKGGHGIRKLSGSGFNVNGIVGNAGYGTEVECCNHIDHEGKLIDDFASHENPIYIFDAILITAQLMR